MPDRLREEVTNLTVAVVGMKGALEDIQRLLKDDIDELKTEIETQRKLAKYGRRTWFEVMAWIFIVGLMVSDMARSYCTPDPQGVAPYPQTCDTVFWATSHGGGPGWRLLGFSIQAALLIWMAHRSQVPPEIFDRVPVAADMPSDDTGKRVRRRDKLMRRS